MAGLPSSGAYNGAKVMVRVNMGTDAAPNYVSVAAQTGLSREKSVEMLDASVKGSKHKESSYGQHEGSFTLEALSSFKDGSQQRLSDAQDDEEIIMLRYVVDKTAISDTATEDIVKEAPALISSISEEAANNENATFSCELTLNDFWEDVVVAP